jgi:general stress protein YciG
MEKKKCKRGFASMDPEKRKKAQRKGGLTRSQDKSIMAKIGSLGGKKISKNRKWMKKISRLGVLARQKHVKST